MPYYGQFYSLSFAAACNLFAGAIVLMAARRVSPTIVDEPSSPSVDRTSSPRSVEPFFGLVLGFLSLGFEMVLFRIMMLTHLPLPSTFASTLCGFLLFWSLGVFVARRFERRFVSVFLITALAVVAVLLVYQIDRYDFRLHRWTCLLYTSPSPRD